MYIKQAFKEKYEKLTNWKKYEEIINTFRRKTIRVNTLKTTVPILTRTLKKQEWSLTKIPWCKEAYYIEGLRRDIGNTKEHKQGHFFSQRSTSLLPSILLQPKETDVVLDMCAAPGGKTTHLAALMNNKGAIIANEPVPNRRKELEINLQRCGVMNTIVTQQNGLTIKNIQFDKILLDAPCSNSGSLRGNTKKSAEIMQQWSVNKVKKFAKLQKKLLNHAYSLLKPKGTIIYSTCSLDPEEDEEVIEDLLEKTDAKLNTINLPIKTGNKKYCKIWPQDQNTDGFFLTKITKP